MATKTRDTRCISCQVPTSSLYRFGAAWLGYDVYDGSGLSRDADGDRVDFDRDTLTHEPRRYGFHATLKAPFRLTETFDESDLVSAFESFAGRPRSIPNVQLNVRAIGAFVALAPTSSCASLHALADDSVMALDPFRAPLREADRQRRNVKSLSPSQIANLERWGYPYVFDEFRFHMTLTGKMDLQRQPIVAEMLQRLFLEQCGEAPVPIDRLALVRQQAPHRAFQVFRHVDVKESS